MKRTINKINDEELEVIDTVENKHFVVKKELLEEKARIEELLKHF